MSTGASITASGSQLVEAAKHSFRRSYSADARMTCILWRRAYVDEANATQRAEELPVGGSCYDGGSK